MGTFLGQRELNLILQHGSEAYPNECCGVLLGKEENGSKVVTDVARLQNVWGGESNALATGGEANAGKTTEAQGASPSESTRNRYLIDPNELMELDRNTRKRGLDIVGFYHSHPDHPARPSEFDRVHAWPWYTYLILAVAKGAPGDLTGWVLSEDRSVFLPEKVEMAEDTSRTANVSEPRRA